ncbi:MAG: VCBS repeat-containing protein [Planctomycetota bacterium]
MRSPINFNVNIITGLSIIQALSLFAGLVLSRPAGAWADPDKDSRTFQYFSLEFKNTAVDEIILEDLNNDGRLELIIQQQRKLDIYSLTADVSAAPKWQQVSDFNLPVDVCLMDLADITGDKIPELVTITPAGISYFSFNNKSFADRPVHLLDIRTIALGSRLGGTDTPLFNKFLTDLDNDGDVDMVIPALSGQQADLIIVRQTSPDPIGGPAPMLIGASPAIFEVIQKIPVETANMIRIEETLFEPLKTSIAFPLINFADINGDKKVDLLMCQNDFISIRLQNDEGRFELNRDILSQKLDFSLGKRSKSEQSNLAYQLGPLIKDINQDGGVDLVVSDEGEGLTAIFLNRGDFKSDQAAPVLVPPLAGQGGAETAAFFDSRKPEQIKRVKGWIINHQLTDLNNDGFQDLILIQMHKVGVMGGLRLLLAQEVNWEINVYLARPLIPLPDGHRGVGEAAKIKIYPDNPDYSRTFSVPFTASVSASQFDFQTPCLLRFDGDFNNDGLKDLVVKDGPEDKIKIYFGNNNEIFNNEPAVSLPMSTPPDYLPVSKDKPYGEPIVADLDRNGKDDIIVLHRDFGSQNYFLDVFLMY